jgi:3-deoxy-D-manno-octulosonic-acid transferase
MRSLPFIYTWLVSTVALASAPFWGLIVAAKEKHRAGFIQKTLGRIPQRDLSTPPPIWYHAVSVGEVMASLPLIQEINKRFPARPVWVSTVTATGHATAGSRIPWAGGVFYFPYDLPWIMDRIIKGLRPVLFITTETEIWPNCIWRLHRYRVPAVLVNGRISDRSLVWYTRFRFLFRPVLQCFDRLCMQSEQSARRIQAMGAPEGRIRITGNLKFDQDLPNALDQRNWRTRLGLNKGERIFVAGSTHPGEEEILLGAFRTLQSQYPHLRMILAPRAPERFDEVAGLIAKMGLTGWRRTAPSDGASPDVILLDTIGELPKIYGLAEVGFVGGSLVPHGGHNPLEVAAHACPVLFGHHMENFREIALLLIEANGALEVRHRGDVEAALFKILGEPSTGKRMGDKALEVLKSNRGAAGRTLAAIEPFLLRLQ